MYNSTDTKMKLIGGLCLKYWNVICCTLLYTKCIR